MTPRRRRVISLLFLFAALTPGCQSAQKTAADKIADALPRGLGPAAHYEVQIEGDTFALTRGRAQRIHIVGQQVQLAPDTTLDSLDIDAHDVSFDTRTKRIEKAGQVTFLGMVGQQNLTRYLETHHPLVPGLAVQLRPHDVLAVVPISVPGIHTRAKVSGRLAPNADQPDHLDFVADTASVGRLPIPAQLVNAALHLVNPVFNLSGVKVPITITRADVVDGQMTLHGTAKLDNFQTL